jgi:hypothetical protein
MAKKVRAIEFQMLQQQKQPSRSANINTVKSVVGQN